MSRLLTGLLFTGLGVGLIYFSRWIVEINRRLLDFPTGERGLRVARWAIRLAGVYVILVGVVNI